MSLFGGKHADGSGGDASSPSGDVRSAARPEPKRETQSTPAGGGEEMANIGKSISIKGDLTGNEDISIEGKVEGKVDLPAGQLTIGANGMVQGEVQAKSVIVIGRVKGNVNGVERVEIQATGQVDGDVMAPKLVVAEGAVLNGSIQMGRPPGLSAGAPPAEEARKAAG